MTAARTATIAEPRRAAAHDGDGSNGRNIGIGIGIGIGTEPWRSIVLQRCRRSPTERANSQPSQRRLLRLARQNGNRRGHLRKS